MNPFAPPKMTTGWPMVGPQTKRHITKEDTVRPMVTQQHTLLSGRKRSSDVATTNVIVTQTIKKRHQMQARKHTKSKAAKQRKCCNALPQQQQQFTSRTLLLPREIFKPPIETLVLKSKKMRSVLTCSNQRLTNEILPYGIPRYKTLAHVSTYLMNEILPYGIARYKTLGPSGVTPGDGSLPTYSQTTRMRVGPTMAPQ